jgi:hypothetical protein
MADRSGWVIGTVSFLDETPTGFLRLADGKSHRFTATLAHGRAGLYRRASARAVSGWIVLADGTVRGATARIADGSDNTIVRPLSARFIDESANPVVARATTRLGGG